MNAIHCNDLFLIANSASAPHMKLGTDMLPSIWTAFHYHGTLSLALCLLPISREICAYAQNSTLEWTVTSFKQ